MSRALQSLTSTSPKTWSSARSTGTGSPSRLGSPITAPSSSSMSSRRLGPKRGASAPGGLDWPLRAHDRRPARRPPCRRGRGSRRAGGASWAAAARRRGGRGGRGSSRARARSRSRRSRRPRRAGAARRRARPKSGASSSAATSAHASGPAAISALSDAGGPGTAGPTAARSSTRSPSAGADARRARRGGEKTPSGSVTGGPSACRSSTGSENEHEPIETNSPRAAARAASRSAAGSRSASTARSSASPAPRVARAAAAMRRLRKPCSRSVRTGWWSPAVALKASSSVARRDEEGRHLLDRRHPRAAAAQLRLARPRAATAASVSRQPSSSGTSQNVSTPARSTRAAPDHLDRLDAERRVAPVAAVEHDAERRARPRRASARLELAQPRGRADEAREHPALLARRGRARPPRPPPSMSRLAGGNSGAWSIRRASPSIPPAPR